MPPLRKLRPVAMVLLWLIALASLLLGMAPGVAMVVDGADILSSFLPLAIPVGLLALIPALLMRRWAMVAIAMMGIALAVVPLWQEWRAREENAPAQPIVPGETRVVIVTHNVAKANVDPALTIAVLEQANADILLLQETKGKGGTILPALARRYRWHSQCSGWCDLSIFSRLPLTRVQWKFRNASGERIGPPLTWTMATLPDGANFPIVTVHQPWPGPAQDGFRTGLIAMMGRIPRDGALLAGDFNLTPWARGMRELDGGLYPMRRITRSRFSFPARIDGGKPWPLPFLPIDQMFAGPDWRVESIERLARSGSDHFGLRITLIHRNINRSAGKRPVLQE